MKGKPITHLTRLGLERLIEEHFWEGKVGYSHNNLCRLFNMPRFGFSIYEEWSEYWNSINHYKVSFIPSYFGWGFDDCDYEAAQFASAALRLLVIHEFLDYLESEGLLA